jgi:hypothetical protein
MVAPILGMEPPVGVKPITDERVRGNSIRLYACSQLGWQTTMTKELADPASGQQTDPVHL